MRMNFATLFDYNYLEQGLVLYESLESVCKNDFMLYVLALDDRTEKYLQDLKNEKRYEVISLDEIVTRYPVLERLQNERTKAEFCYTLSSFSTQYCLNVYNLDNCTYINADMVFYHDPISLYNEMGQHSVMITEHNYYPEYDQTDTSGKYCVQFMCFKNNDEGRRVLEWWRQRVEEECSEIPVNGMLGDQGYLNDWESRFAGIVYNCRNIGCGVAPWNCQYYDVVIKNGLYVRDKVTKVEMPIIFYHFHGFRRLKKQLWWISKYNIADSIKEYLYVDYIKRLIVVENGLPVDLIPSFLDDRKVDYYRFFPVPYLGNKNNIIEDYDEDNLNGELLEVKKRIEKEDGTIDSLLVRNKYDKQSRCVILYQKVQFEGDWVRILEISNPKFFSENAHEIIWQMQKQTSYPYESIQDAFASIINAVGKRRICAECCKESLKSYVPKHPLFIEKSMQKSSTFVRLNNNVLLHKESIFDEHEYIYWDKDKHSLYINCYV